MCLFKLKSFQRETEEGNVTLVDVSLDCGQVKRRKTEEDFAGRHCTGGRRGHLSGLRHN